MQTSRNREMIVPGVEITPVYQNKIAQIENHYKVMVAELKVKRDFFNQDLEEVSGGVR